MAFFAEIDNNWAWDWLNYELVPENSVWRFLAVLSIIIFSMAIGRTVQFLFERVSRIAKLEKKVTTLKLTISALAKPAYYICFVIGFSTCRKLLVFENLSTAPPTPGIRTSILNIWNEAIEVLYIVAFAYALFHLIEVIEYYLLKAASRTKTTLDDMLVPIIRKALRITISIIAVLFIAENILGEGSVRSLIVSAGIGGIALAMAAKDTLANFFGSVMIFADRPFHINELVKVGQHLGTIEEVGFRSTKIRTLEGHVVTVPNSIIANSDIENIQKRRLIRRTSNITITYDSGHTKATKAVEIVKKILAEIQEINTSSEHIPRVYFDEFNDCSLNIYMTYWVSPADWWSFKEINQKVNVEIMKQFEKENIEFAFPTQTLYMKNDTANQ